MLYRSRLGAPSVAPGSTADGDPTDQEAATDTTTIQDSREAFGPHTPEDVARYYAEGHWQDRVLVDVVREHARRDASRLFVTDGTQRVTYGDLLERSIRVATGLRELGVDRGDRVAVQLPNWAEFAVLAVALSRLGAVLVPIMAIFRADEVRYIVGHSGANVLIGPETFNRFSYAEMYREVRAAVPTLRTVALVRSADPTALVDEVPFERLEAGSTDTAALDESLGDTARPDDGCLIVYTSGTTSRPKGCYHTFNTLHASAVGMIRRLGVDEHDVFFNPSPVCHSTGFVTGMVMPLLVGGATHFMERWEPSEGLRRIKEYGCTVTYTSTTFLTTLMQAYRADEHDMSSMRYWVCAGAPIPGSVVQAARSLYPSCSVLSLYGRSENMTTTMCGPDDEPERSATSDGRALPGAAIRVVGRDGEEMERGEDGDIAYHGPSHMLGYYDDPIETAKLYTPEGYSRSGDLGYMDADGFVRVNGRIKDIIIRGGINVSSREVEDLLIQHPAVQEVAVVAMPDARLGERSCAYVVAAPGTAPSLQELTDFLRAKEIAVQKLPERVELIDALPVTAIGKVRKNVLREDIATKLRAEATA
jgi:cyclohexanecarboxylate-CoA ligase